MCIFFINFFFLGFAFFFVQNSILDGYDDEEIENAGANANSGRGRGGRGGGPGRRTLRLGIGGFFVKVIYKIKLVLSIYCSKI